jgi:hypothetical protein
MSLCVILRLCQYQEYIASDGKVIDKFEKVWNETVA